MTKHVMPRALICAPRAEGADPVALLAELKDTLKNSVTQITADQKTKFDALQTAHTALKAELDGVKAKTTDVVTTEKVDRINAAIDAVKGTMTTNQAAVDAIKAEVEKVTGQIAALQVSGGGAAKSRDPRASNPHAADYAKNFETYFRKGEQAIPGGTNALRELEVKAAMSVGSDPDGGYTVMPEMETEIDEVVKEVSPMRTLASVRQIGTDEYRKLVNQHGTASGWVGEADSRPQTAGANLSDLKFPVMEVYAMPAATQKLLDDSFVDIASWLAGEVQLEFAQKEGAAFIAGDGQSKPLGFVGGYENVANASYAWGKIGYIATGASGAFKTDDSPTKPADCLIDLYHSVKSAYRVNSSFVANRGTLGAIRKLKDANGDYLVQFLLRNEGFVEQILGRPAVEMPDMPDMAANSYSVGFGDFKRGYLIIDRVGIRVLRDPYTAKPFVLFYTTKRVGGGVQNFEALKLLKFATS